MGADHDVRTGRGDLLGEPLLVAGRAGHALVAPVQVDHHDVGLVGRGAHRAEQSHGALPARGGQARARTGATAQVASTLSRGEASAASTATSVPRTVVRYGRKAAAGVRPAPRTATGESSPAARVSRRPGAP